MPTTADLGCRNPIQLRGLRFLRCVWVRAVDWNGDFIVYVRVELVEFTFLTLHYSIMFCVTVEQLFIQVCLYMFESST